MTRRRQIPRDLREFVVARGGMNCQHCGTPVTHRSDPSVPLPNEAHIDHLTPWACGGEHSPENVVISCRACNLSRPNALARVADVRLVLREGPGWAWPAGYTPPRILPTSVCSIPIEEYPRRRGSPLQWTVSRVQRGWLAATATGRVYVEIPESPDTERAWKMRRSRARQRRARE